MPIELITGLPGAGKSLGLVAKMLELRDKAPERPVYVLGVDGLEDGIAERIEPDDLRRWMEYPPGSIFVVDECQEYFPMRRGGEPAAWVKELSKHRHYGHDFLMSTQQPQFVDTYVRGLVDHHTHLVRKFGTGIVDRYEWGAVNMNPLSRAERKTAVHSIWKHPRRCFELYKSAELHTVKRRVPKKLWLLLAIPVALVAAVLLVPAIMRHGEGAGGTLSAQPPASAGLLRVADSGSGGRSKWPTVESYVAARLPRIANQPWSAPIYDDQPVKARPDLLCIEYHRTINGMDQHLCSCFTEQVTPYDLHSLAECRRYARHGVYNPRREPLEDPRFDRRDGGSDSSSGASRSEASSAAPGSGVEWSRERSSIGAPYVPPGLQQPYMPGRRGR